MTDANTPSEQTAAAVLAVYPVPSKSVKTSDKLADAPGEDLVVVEAFVEGLVVAKVDDAAASLPTKSSENISGGRGSDAADSVAADWGAT